MMKHLVRVSAVFIFCMVLLVGGEVHGQAPVSVPAPTPVSGGGGVIIRSLWTEIVLTVIMVGLALFAVARSSNRS